jgi:hypothetical protein
MTDPNEFWSSFTLDPRSPEHAPMRASDRDRNLVHQALADAYADGRLDQEEFESRTSATTTAKTLGNLVALVEGLVPTSWVPATRARSSLMSDAEIRQRAVTEWRDARRNALWGFISVSLVCWVIWAVTSQGFPWPVFVMLGTGLHVGRIQFTRQAMIEEEHRRLEKKQAREIEKRRRKGELE